MNNKSGNILFVLAFFIGIFLGITSMVYATYYPPMPRKSAPETYKVYSMDKVYTGLTWNYTSDCRIYFKKDGKTILFSGTFIVEQE